MQNKLIFTALFLLIFNFGNTQVFFKNNISLDVYYGGPNWFTFLNKLESGYLTNTQLSGFGPVGVRGEFMLTELIGIGVDFGYNRSSAKQQFSEYNSLTGQYDNYYHTSKTQKIGAIATFNFHPIKNDKFDIAVVGGLGYGKRTFGSDYPAAYAYLFAPPTSSGYVYNFFQSTDSFGGAGSITVPLSFKVGMVMRFFITENIGFNLSVGATHGGIVNGGISAKF